jgi:hypothetical protein
MARSIGEFNPHPSGSTVPDLKVKIPTIDLLMRPPEPPPWWRLLPPPAPPGPNPFGPVPIIPAPPSPPIEVSPPSRPPQWMFGPPYITEAPTQTPRPNPTPAPSGYIDRAQVPSENIQQRSPPAAQTKPGGLLGMLIDAGHIDPPMPDQPPAGGLAGLLQEYLRNNPRAGR